MLLGALRMPIPDDPDPMTLNQFVSRARQAADRIESDTAKIEALQTEVERLQAATQLCDKHAPKGGTVAACVICSGQKLSYALSRISYLCEPPNEMEFSSYDLHYNEDAVVAQVERLRKDAVRYRKLRSPLFGRGIRVIMPTPYPAILSGAELDREIDAALKEGER